MSSVSSLSVGTSEDRFVVVDVIAGLFEPAEEGKSRSACRAEIERHSA
ncbi:hypothetical protein ACFYXQ_32695 [Nocardia jiangxiensis]|uniref:Uncharacterized protein n=1 Tax=Nocardia jiangxiensis TaxID=282685 RepID=A0ABW6S8D3_9NOCA